ASRSATVSAGQSTRLDVALEHAAPVPAPQGSITIVTPPDGIETGEDAVLVSGKVQLAGLAKLTVAGAVAGFDADGNFATPVSLAEGVNALTVRAADAQGGAIEATVHVVYTPAAPPLQKLSDAGCASGPAGLWAALALAFALWLRRRPLRSIGRRGAGKDEPRRTRRPRR